MEGMKERNIKNPTEQKSSLSMKDMTPPIKELISVR